jgi:hypothetical protein
MVENHPTNRGDHDWGGPAFVEIMMATINAEPADTIGTGIHEKRFQMLRVFRLQMVILFAAVIFYTVYAFASSETNVTSRGEGAHTISGWNVSNIQYRLADSSANVSAVEFDLDAPAGVVKVGFGSYANGYFNCRNDNGMHWICELYPQVQVSTLSELRVVAIGN